MTGTMYQILYTKHNIRCIIYLYTMYYILPTTYLQDILYYHTPVHVVSWTPKAGHTSRSSPSVTRSWARSTRALAPAMALTWRRPRESAPMSTKAPYSWTDVTSAFTWEFLRIGGVLFCFKCKTKWLWMDVTLASLEGSGGLTCVGFIVGVVGVLMQGLWGILTELAKSNGHPSLASQTTSPQIPYRKSLTVYNSTAARLASLPGKAPRKCRARPC